MAVLSSSHRDAAAYPLQSLFVPFPFVCFTLTLATDIAFYLSANLMWQNFSSWLLFAGLALGGVALIAGLLDLVRPRTRPLRPAFLSALLYVIILALAFINSLVHAGDGWTAVVPYGLGLSAITFVLCLIAVVVSARKYARLAWRI
jgi:Predicted membrane protein